MKPHPRVTAYAKNPHFTKREAEALLYVLSAAPQDLILEVLEAEACKRQTYNNAVRKLAAAVGRS